MVGLVALALTLSVPGPFVLANQAGAPLTEVSLRSLGGGAFRPIGGGTSIPDGGRTEVASPGGQDCGFDIRARVGGTLVTWTGVNLCDVRIVTLNRRSDGTLWVDYD